MSTLNWYPGMGELQLIGQMAPETQRILRFAAAEDPTFVAEYLLPVLGEDDPEGSILGDYAYAVAEEELDQLSGLGFLGKKKKGIVRKMKRWHKTAFKKTTPKAVSKAHAKVEKAGKKVWRQYGNLILTVVGAVLAPFTGGASVAAAAVLVAANTAYQKKRAADAAKAAGKVEAGAMQAEAAKANAEVRSQLSTFYNNNSKWFIDLGVTRAKWDGLSTEAQIELIKAGAEGRMPNYPTAAPAPAPTPPTAAAPQPAPAPMPSAGSSGSFNSGGGGGGGGGGYPPEALDTAGGLAPPGGAPPGQAPQRQLATAGMFGSPLILAAGGAVLAMMLFSKKSKGRTRRNPRRRWSA